MLDQIARVPGVGSTRQFGSEYAMRIWLNPDKLQGYGLSASQVLAAVKAQNVQFAAGSIGADPAPLGQGFTATRVAPKVASPRPQQFADIILRANSGRHHGQPWATSPGSRSGRPTTASTRTTTASRSAPSPIQLLPGANALNVATAVRSKMDELAPSFPQGVTWFSPYDTTAFVKISIDEVVKTLIEAIVLVFLVMLLFLQNFRATIIPTLVIPVALLGTFMGMLALGFSINQLTLFGMVLAIGIVVDDAIVVIENVERIMTEEDLSPKEATRKAMGQITGAVVAITVVLAAVFVPSSLQPGASGIIYKQFALTIADVDGLLRVPRAVVHPGLVRELPEAGARQEEEHRLSQVQRLLRLDHAHLHRPYRQRGQPCTALDDRLRADRRARRLPVHAPARQLPARGGPGLRAGDVQLPPGATMQRTSEVMDRDARDPGARTAAVEGVLQITGFSFVGSGRKRRHGLHPAQGLEPTATSPRASSSSAPTAPCSRSTMRRSSWSTCPRCSGLGQFGGFDMYLQDRTGAGRDALTKARNTLLAKAAQNPLLTGVRPNALEDAPQLQLNVDRVQAQSMGLSVGDIYNAVQPDAGTGLRQRLHLRRPRQAGHRCRPMRRSARGRNALDHIFTPSTPRPPATAPRR